MNQPLRRIESSFVVLPAENIDTDQICPARFLTSTARSGFKQALFADWRYDKSGAARPEFPLNRPEALGTRRAGERPELRLRFIARARGVGAAGERHSGGDRHRRWRISSDATP
jgi:hypothetical protein